MLQCWVTEQDLAGSPMHNETSPSPHTPLGTAHSPTPSRGTKDPTHPSSPTEPGAHTHLSLSTRAPLRTSPRWGNPVCTMGSAWHGGAAGPGMAAVRTASIFSSKKKKKKNQNHQKEKAKKKKNNPNDNGRIKESPSGRKSFFFFFFFFCFVSWLPLLGCLGSLHCWSLILK